MRLDGVTHLPRDVGVCVDAAHSLVGDGQVEPDPVVGFVCGDGDAGPGGGAGLVEYAAQRVEVDGLVAVPVEV